MIAPPATVSILRAVTAVVDELKAATTRYGPMRSAREGYAVLLEEVEELWAEVKKKPEARNPEKMRDEARQVAAMAIRFMLDVCAADPQPERRTAARRAGVERRTYGNPRRKEVRVDSFGRRNGDRRKNREDRRAL